MRMFPRFLSISATVLALAVPGVSNAWNSTGHRAIASIAYYHLDEPTRKRVAGILKNHPAFDTLWTHRPANGDDETLNLFWNAAVFPDDARGQPFQRYGRSAAHYVNYRIMADAANTILPPLKDENILNSYIAHRRQILDPRTPADRKALHLSWVFHQVGDIHQPLHAVERFSRAFPHGDKGGNGVTIPNPRARGARSNNLHAYWDDALGIDDSPAAVEVLAIGIIAQFPRSDFVEEMKKNNIRDWAEESIAASIQQVYHDLDPNILNFAEAPVGYDADARKVARRRAALAGYRLAEELKQIVVQP